MVTDKTVARPQMVDTMWHLFAIMDTACKRLGLRVVSVCGLVPGRVQWQVELIMA